jgi:RNA 3'-terminal phosphate cyclase (ATP)
MEDFIQVDGSMYEGGGQIIRLSLGLAILTRKNVCVFNIRAGRSNPGLALSHLTAVNLLASISGGRVEGNFKGSTSITFFPGQLRGGTYHAICPSAGSTNLILQAALPVLIQTNSFLTITGGTDTDFSPPSSFVLNVFLPALRKLGINVDLEVHRFGFYPKGQGELRITTHLSTSPPSPLNLQEIDYYNYLTSILATQNVKNSPQLSRILQEIQGIQEEKVEIKYVKSNDKAIVASFYCESSFVPLSRSFIENFKNSQWNVQDISNELKREVENKHCVDEFLQDQILVYLAMASGPSSIYTTYITPHTEGVIFLINLFGIANVQFLNNSIEVVPVNFKV